MLNAAVSIAPADAIPSLLYDLSASLVSRATEIGSCSSSDPLQLSGGNSEAAMVTSLHANASLAGTANLLILNRICSLTLSVELDYRFRAPRSHSSD